MGVFLQMCLKINIEWVSSRYKQVLRFANKCGVITKYTKNSIDGNPLNFDFGPHMEEDTHQFTAAPLNNEAVAANIAGESR